MVQATLQAYNPSFREKSQGVLANLFTKMGLAKDFGIEVSYPFFKGVSIFGLNLRRINKKYYLINYN